jgi:hypothetical protein
MAELPFFLLLLADCYEALDKLRVSLLFEFECINLNLLLDCLLVTLDLLVVYVGLRVGCYVGP